MDESQEPEACRKTHPITTRNNVQQHTLCLFLSEVGTIIPPEKSGGGKIVVLLHLYIIA
jgi:hypothetical protein